MLTHTTLAIVSPVLRYQWGRSERKKNESPDAQQKCSFSDGQFETALDHVANLLTLVLDLTTVVRPRLDDMDIAIEQPVFGIRRQPLETNSRRVVAVFDDDCRALAIMVDGNVRFAWIAEKIGDAGVQSGRDPMQQTQRWRGLVAFDLGDKTFRAVDQLRHVLLSEAFELAGEAKLGAEIPEFHRFASLQRSSVSFTGRLDGTSCRPRLTPDDLLRREKDGSPEGTRNPPFGF